MLLSQARDFLFTMIQREHDGSKTFTLLPETRKEVNSRKLLTLKAWTMLHSLKTASLMLIYVCDRKIK